MIDIKSWDLKVVLGLVEALVSPARNTYIGELAGWYTPSHGWLVLSNESLYD